MDTQSRRFLPALLAVLALSLLDRPARADDGTLRAEIDTLRARAEALESQRRLLFDHEVEHYLGQTETWHAAQGDGFAGVTIRARVTAVHLSTLGADPGNSHATHGDADIDLDFEVTDNLELFVSITANTEGDFPSGFGPIAGTAGATLSGLHDGIGVDGTVSTSPGSARVAEAGIRWATPVGSKTLHVMLGKLDPRNTIAGNRFANDENTQFLNNLFDDPPAITWVNNATGTTLYAIHLWMNFGDREQWRADFGFYNTPGQFFNDGVFYWQVAWTGKLSDRELNVRLYGQVDTRPRDASAALGVSADWMATDTIGVFVRMTVRDNRSINAGERNSVESDWQIGAEARGLFPSRPNDTAGVAWGLIKGPVNGVIPLARENHEYVIEFYYRFMLEGDRLEITPLLQVILDPGAGTFADPDQLFLLGVRIHVPF